MQQPGRPRILLTPEMKEVKRKLANEKMRLYVAERRRLARLEKASAVGTHSVEALPPAQLPPIAQQEAPIVEERAIDPANISWLDSGDPILKDRRRVSGTDILNGYSPYAARS